MTSYDDLAFSGVQSQRPVLTFRCALCNQNFQGTCFPVYLMRANGETERMLLPNTAPASRGGAATNNASAECPSCGHAASAVTNGPASTSAASTAPNPAEPNVHAATS